MSRNLTIVNLFCFWKKNGYRICVSLVNHKPEVPLTSFYKSPFQSGISSFPFFVFVQCCIFFCDGWFFKPDSTVHIIKSYNTRPCCLVRILFEQEIKPFQLWQAYKKDITKISSQHLTARHTLIHSWRECSFFWVGFVKEHSGPSQQHFISCRYPN